MQNMAACRDWLGSTAARVYPPKSLIKKGKGRAHLYPFYYYVLQNQQIEKPRPTSAKHNNTTPFFYLCSIFLPRPILIAHFYYIIDGN